VILSSVTIKLIFFFSISAFLLGTCRFIFNFAIVKHAKIVDFLGTHWHTKILVGTLILRINKIAKMQEYIISNVSVKTYSIIRAIKDTDIVSYINI